MLYLDQIRAAVPTFPDAVHVKRADGFGKGPFYAYVRGYEPEGDWLLVRLELPDEHSAVKDALADNPHLTSDQLEFEAFVPRRSATNLDAKVPDPRPALKRAEEDRLAREAAAERARRARAIRAEMAAGVRPRPLLPELDAHIHESAATSGERRRT